MSLIQDLLEKSIHGAILDTLVEQGLAPDVRDEVAYPDGANGIANYKIAQQAIVNDKGYHVKLFGAGSTQSRGSKDVPRVVMSSSAFIPGFLGRDTVLKYMPGSLPGHFKTQTFTAQRSNDFEFTIFLVASKQQQIRVLTDALFKSIPVRGYMPFIGLGEDDKFMVEFVSDFDTPDLDTGLIEKALRFRVSDVYLTETIEVDNAVPGLVDIDLNLFADEERFTKKVWGVLFKTKTTAIGDIEIYRYLEIASGMFENSSSIAGNIILGLQAIANTLESTTSQPVSITDVLRAIIDLVEYSESNGVTIYSLLGINIINTEYSESTAVTVYNIINTLMEQLEQSGSNNTILAYVLFANNYNTELATGSGLPMYYVMHLASQQEEVTTSNAVSLNILEAFDINYQAVLTYATAQGYTLPTATQQIKENQAVINAKADLSWERSFVWFNCATDGDQNYACINYKNPGTYSLQLVNSPVFTPLIGFKGNGTTAEVRVYINPSTLSWGAFGQNNASIWAFMSFESIGTNTSLGYTVFGTSFGGNVYHSSNVWRYGINNTGTGSITFGSFTTDRQLVASSRANSAEYKVYRNAQSATATNASSPPPNVSYLRFVSPNSLQEFSMGGVGIAIDDIFSNLDTNITSYINSL